eukprot:sb/3474405/
MSPRVNPKMNILHLMPDLTKLSGVLEDPWDTLLITNLVCWRHRHPVRSHQVSMSPRADPNRELMLGNLKLVLSHRADEKDCVAWQLIPTSPRTRSEKGPYVKLLVIGRIGEIKIFPFQRNQDQVFILSETRNRIIRIF